jgi:hypothetical protein
LTPDPIPQEVRNFISEQMRSISGIRLLLLLHVDPVRDWSAQELAHELRAASEWAERELRLLAAQGLLAASDADSSRFRYLEQEPPRRCLVTSRQAVTGPRTTCESAENKRLPGGSPFYSLPARSP